MSADLFGRPRSPGRRTATRGMLPDGLRVYAVGDIHGRFDLLQAVHAQIRLDLDAAPPARSVEIYLGDYLDRGPQSRQVLEWLIEAAPAADERICLMGNHEDMLLGALAEPALLPQWLHNGGWETLDSYRPATWPRLSAVTVAEAHAALSAALPAGHRAFLAGLPRMAQFGSYLFVHAGLMPGRASADQDPQDLIWIREPFLSCHDDFGLVVVHGHTPVLEPEIRPNRINIDTGAFFTGLLTCLALQGGEQRLLQAQAATA